jgi:hypothetical protein
MGYMVHHTIIVTGDGRESWMEPGRATIEDAHAFAVACAGRHDGVCGVSALIDTSTNGYRSFMVAPDGSKDGWNTSDKGNNTRAEIVAWLRTIGGFDFAEVQFGDEEGDNRLLAHNADGVE